MRFFDQTKPGLIAMALSALLVTANVNAEQDTDQLLEKLEQLQHQIDELKAVLIETREQGTATDAKVEAVAEVIEGGGIGPARTQDTFLGGYGELHYNNLSAVDSSRDLEQIDLHRFVMFMGHTFNDSARFYSELEVEHALVADTGGNTPGEVELEQAYLEFDIKSRLHSRAGVFLVPVGILNETHEPDAFYGVERNDVENIIVPSTWWEAGAGLNGRFGSDWRWDLALTSGLQIDTQGANAFRVRSGRQKVAKALASELAVTARLVYAGVPGLKAGLTLHHQFDPSQVADDGLDDGTLLETHLDYRTGRFGLRALFAQWDFSGEGVEDAAAEHQAGWYVEPSYRAHDKLGFYTRFEDVEGARDSDQFDQWEFGLNYWPAPNVVLKFDYRDRSHDLESAAGRDFDGFDLGLGYSF